MPTPTPPSSPGRRVPPRVSLPSTGRVPDAVRRLTASLPAWPASLPDLPGRTPRRGSPPPPSSRQASSRQASSRQASSQQPTSPVAVALNQALTMRRHPRSAATLVLGSDRALLSRSHGRSHAGHPYSPDLEHVDLGELAWVHGRVLPALARHRRSLDHRRITGHQPHATATVIDGPFPWTRLCVSTDEGYRGVIGGHPEHIDVAVLPLDPTAPTYAADLRLLLPGGLPPGPVLPVSRLHLPGGNRLVVDDGEHCTVLDGGRGTMPPHRASLLVLDGRVVRAEVVLAVRWNPENLKDLAEGFS